MVSGSQHNDVFMDSFDVPTHHTREPPYRQLALAQRGTYDVPALLGQLPKKLGWRFEIQYLTPGTSSIALPWPPLAAPLPVRLQGDSEITVCHFALPAATAVPVR